MCEYKVWIDGWVEQLQTGVPDEFGYLQPACPYDLQNLKWSCKFLMNSISPSFVNMIEPELGSSPAGPVVFYKIMNKVQMMSAEAMRKLEKELKGLILKQEPGENVETFCNKIQGVAEKLDQEPEYKPVDLNLLVAENLSIVV